MAIGFFSIAMVNCSPKKHADSHQHEDNLQLVSYNNDFEVFAEASPFVKGHPSTIVAYISSLKDFKPLQSGKVTLSLIIGKSGVRQTIDKPAQQGVYRFSLTPETVGKGKLLLEIQSGDSISKMEISNIEIFSDEHEAYEAAVKAIVTSSNAVAFTKEQSWKVDFATEEVRSEPFGNIIKTTAQVLPSQGDERIIVAKSSGIVTLSNADIIEGKAVSSGQQLFSIESGNMADNNMNVRYAEALNNYTLAKSEYERKQKLAKDKIVSQSDLQRSKTEYENAESIYENLKRNFSQTGQRVSSPIPGFVKQIFVRNGEYVEAGQPIIAVSQNKNLYIRAELQSKYYPVLNEIVTANLRIPKTNTNYRLEDVNGKLISYGKAADLENPLVPVTFQINNSINLLPGSFVELYIKTQSDNNQHTVANDALIEEMGNYFVFVQLTPILFEKREVEKGISDGYRTVIKSGVVPGERVVSKGAVLVKLAQASGALDPHAGHVH